MPATLLLISDIHGNYPALAAVAEECRGKLFDLIINCGDTTVYAPFPNETLAWLRQNRVLSILGNTDRKVLKLLKGKKMKKPGMPEKRIMYTWTAEHLTPENQVYLAAMAKQSSILLEGFRIGIFHGSPADGDEFLFDDTPDDRFRELAGTTNCDIILTGHSHSPFHKQVNKIHFINSGSVGRMFDGNPEASYAIIELERGNIKVDLFRCAYPIKKVIHGLQDNNLPRIYEEMYRQGRKLN